MSTNLDKITTEKTGIRENRIAAPSGHQEPEKQGSIVEMCITGYGIMDNSVHSTWKSKEQLSHVLQTELPTIP